MTPSNGNEVPAPAAEAIRRMVGDGEIFMLERVELRYDHESGTMAAIDPFAVFYEVKYRKWGLPHETKVDPQGNPAAD